MLDNATPIRIQKSMFICYIEFGKSFPYSFFPNKMGCYSINLHDDYHILANKGYLIRNDQNKYMVNKKEKDLFVLPKAIMLKISDVAKKCNNLTDESLIQYTYEKKPYYAYRSTLLNLMENNSESFKETFDKIKNSIESKSSRIYTIGYEGQNLDYLLAKLLYMNVKTLVDVRKNAFSMRREFSKTSLEHGCNEAGIRYIHCPEVGIESEKRQELLPDGKRKELFDWYEKAILPNRVEFINKMSDLFKDGSICFLCYEKNPHDCHRLHLANFCLNSNSSFNSVENI